MIGSIPILSFSRIRVSVFVCVFLVAFVCVQVRRTNKLGKSTLLSRDASFLAIACRAGIGADENEKWLIGAKLLVSKAQCRDYV